MKFDILLTSQIKAHPIIAIISAIYLLAIAIFLIWVLVHSFTKKEKKNET